MSQSETVTMELPGTLAGNPLLSRAEQRDAWLWRVVPGLFLAAVHGPAILAGLGDLSGRSDLAGGGGPLASALSGVAGALGIALGACVAALVGVCGVWILARACGAPRWAAAAAAVIYAVVPLFGLAPAPWSHVDDAAFGGFAVLAAGSVARFARDGTDLTLAGAFAAATLAGLLRPGAAWPALAVALAAAAALRRGDERLVYGAISSLAWAPGVSLFRMVFEGGPDDSGSLSDGVRRGAQAIDAGQGIIAAIVTTAPLLALLVAAGAGLVLALGLKGPNRPAAIAAGVFVVLALAGAAGAGDLVAARLLLDPLLLGLAGALGLIAPELLRRIRAARAVPAVRS